MKLEWMKAFAIFSETLNFSASARRLNVSQPALFKQIQLLTDWAGSPLYVKTGRSLSLTDAGHQLARFARQTLDDVDRFEADFKGITKAPQIHLAAGQGAYLYLLGPAIRRFVRTRPGRLSLLTADGTETLRLLRSGEAHLGVTVLDGRPRDIDAIPFRETKSQLVVRRSDPLAKRTVLRLKDLSDIPLILPSAPSPLRNAVEKSSGAGLQIVAEARGWELMLHFVSLGIGAAIVNDCCRIGADLVSIPIPGLPTLKYALVQLKDQRTFADLNSLREEILKERD